MIKLVALMKIKTGNNSRVISGDGISSVKIARRVVMVPLLTQD